MPKPVYDDVLTQESEARLTRLVDDLPQPVALAGGHAVRYAVTERWTRRFGEDYFGSRDIDVCYLVDPDWSEEQLRKSAAGQAPDRIKELGYKPMGSYRFGLWVDNEGNVLDREPDPPKMLGVDYHVLAIDAMVTERHPLDKEVLGFTPIDEPLLKHVFQDPAYRTTLDELGPSVHLPTAPVLVATKLKSLPDRGAPDKAVKDLCDLYALTAFGGASTTDIRTVTHEVLAGVPQLVDGAIQHDHLEDALDHLDLSAEDYRAAVGPIALPP